jgi:hypothetical protein
MSSTIPRKVIITRHGKSYRGAYSLEGDVVTVRHTLSDGVIRKMSMPTGGQKAIAVARTICANWPERACTSDTWW